MALNIVFLGTPKFAVASLEAIQKSSHHISAVITVPDKPAGRGQNLIQSEVKKYCLENDLAVFQPEKLKDINFIQDMKKLNPDIMVVVAFKKLPKVLYSIPKFGTFNLHASLLPDLRGAAPINFAIINGLKETGVTTFYIDEQIDTGNILLQKSIPIAEDETAGSLHDKLMELGKGIVVKTLDGIENFSLHTKPQADAMNTQYAPKIDKIFCEINWQDSLKNIDLKVRGLSPYPGAYTYITDDKGKKLFKIYLGTIEYSPQNELSKKIIVENNQMKIPHPEGFYLPTKVQIEGKKIMLIADFINGLQNKNNLQLL